MTSIIYENISVGAKEALKPSASEESKVSKISQLEQSGLLFPNYANPIERYAVILDGNSSPLPSDNNSLIGYWSEQISDEQGNFETPIILSFVQEENKITFTSKGISIYFNSYNNIHPRSIIVRWILSGMVSKEINVDIDNAFFVYREENEVIFDGIEIEFNNLNMPYNRLQVNTVIYGEYVEIGSENLKNVSLTQNLSPLSTEIPIDTANVVIEDDTGRIYNFQERQPLSIISNGSLQGIIYVKNAKRTSKNVWNVDAENVIGILENITFYGGMYENVTIGDFCEELFAGTGIIYMVSEEILQETISGYIPITTVRGALMQLLFATGSNVSTINDDKKIEGLRPDIYIYKQNSLVAPEITQEITEDRILQGQSFQDESAVTAVSVTVHSFIKTEEEIVLYDAEESGVGNNIVVSFSNPIYDLSITNGDILKSSVNHAIINSRENCILIGKEYEHKKASKSKSYNLPKFIKENIKTVPSATLVNSNNIDKVLDMCYNYYAKTKKITSKIKDGLTVTGNELIRYGTNIYYGENYKYRGRTPEVVTYDKETKVGQVLKLPTEYMGEIVAIVTKQSYDLNGNIKVKNSELKVI